MRAFILGVLLSTTACGWTAGEIFATGGDTLAQCAGVVPDQVAQVEGAIHQGGVGWLGVALSAISDAVCLASVVGRHVAAHKATVAGPGELASPLGTGEEWRAAVVVGMCSQAQRVRFVPHRRKRL